MCLTLLHQNEVYRNARFMFRGGTPEFDEAGWINYVDTHRSSDPGISETGKAQAQHLAEYLVPHLYNQASNPVRIITSPMRRTLETIQPTLQGLHDKCPNNPKLTQVQAHGFYYESEG
jgi:broad specificity phosphatase PhoE